MTTALWPLSALLLLNAALVALVLRRLRRLTHKVDRRIDRLERRFGDLLDNAVAISNELKEASGRIQEQGKQILSGQAALESLTGVYSVPLRSPLFFGAWSIDGVMARELVECISKTRPRVILELGSGTSTALIAVTLERLGLQSTRHIAVDHLQEFLDATKRQVELQVTAPHTEFWLCPLNEKSRTKPPWYSNLTDRLAGTQIDLLLVDGPPAALHPKARRPALEVLHPFLSERAIVLLDDANRPREQKTIDAWRRSFPDMAVRTVERGKGFAEFRMQAGARSALDQVPSGTPSRAQER